MSDKSKIEWTDATWNPVVGCTAISDGCLHCYAKRIFERFHPEEKFSKIKFYDDRLDVPLHWKKSRKIFVCSMSDLFHPSIPFSFITVVFDTMCSWRFPNKAAERDGDDSLLVDPGHTFIVLTKRPERISEWLDWVAEYWPGDSPVNTNLTVLGNFGKNIWLGVTAENQAMADKRIPILLKVPAAVRFVSVEPMLERVDLEKFQPFLYKSHPEKLMGLYGIDSGWIDWVICGCESGPGARHFDPEWAQDLKNQCVNAPVPFFYKQGRYDGQIIKTPELDGRQWMEYPKTDWGE